MFEWFLIYVFVCIENFSMVLSLGWAAFCLGGALIFLAVVAAACKADGYNSTGDWGYYWEGYGFCVKLRKLAKPLLWAGGFVGVLGVLLPTQQQMAIIVGSGLAYEAVTSETGKRISSKAVQLLEQQVDEALKNFNGEEAQEETKESATQSGGKASAQAT